MADTNGTNVNTYQVIYKIADYDEEWMTVVETDDIDTWVAEYQEGGHSGRTVVSYNEIAPLLSPYVW